MIHLQRIRMMRKENDKTAEHGLGAAHRDTLRSRLACEDWRGILVSLADIYGI